MEVVVLWFEKVREISEERRGRMLSLGVVLCME